ncbi:ABC transporter ATP-binding protein [Kovacikia minuta CCNUW1]|uniref:ABC transporter ATP-binding protein n=1 Tax=Kovacikia minuta TaxID=2931930 RepID=UPI001CCFFC41|nr:ABC transporter ATP-binding protein [Kovacikia minuta]UBF24077.1 ABC transporter ATP-binding protein [Kovacikia minuta CCNUW1]
MIEVEHLGKVYGSTPAIEDVTFAVEPGEILGFLGPNGAGKTTTMRILAGYLPATVGTAKVAGYEVHENSMAVRQRIGYLPETPPLYPEMTVEGFLHFVARIKGVSAGDRGNRVESSMERCSLLDKRRVLIRKLSKGYRQRVGIAQAIVHDPPAIILDEPTVGLDPRQIIEVRNLIKNLAGSHTVILSTHILPEVSMTCNRVAIINRGRVVATNTPDSLTNQLTAGSGYELEVEGEAEDIETRLVTFLKGLPQVKLVEQMTADLPENRLKLRVVAEQGANLVGRDIAATVVGSGIGLYEMRRTQASLEEVFLQLTTEEKPPDASSEDASLEADQQEPGARSQEPEEGQG